MSVLGYAHYLRLGGCVFCLYDEMVFLSVVILVWWSSVIGDLVVMLC